MGGRGHAPQQTIKSCWQGWHNQYMGNHPAAPVGDSRSCLPLLLLHLPQPTAVPGAASPPRRCLLQPRPWTTPGSSTVLHRCSVTAGCEGSSGQKKEGPQLTPGRPKQVLAKAQPARLPGQARLPGIPQRRDISGGPVGVLALAGEWVTGGCTRALHLPPSLPSHFSSLPSTRLCSPHTPVRCRVGQCACLLVLVLPRHPPAVHSRW